VRKDLIPILITGAASSSASGEALDDDAREVTDDDASDVTGVTGM